MPKNIQMIGALPSFEYGRGVTNPHLDLALGKHDLDLVKADAAYDWLVV